MAALRLCRGLWHKVMKGLGFLLHLHIQAVPGKTLSSTYAAGSSFTSLPMGLQWSGAGLSAFSF